MRPFRSVAITSVLIAATAVAAVPVLAQAYRPLVTMAITLPDGDTKDVSAPDSGLGTITVGRREYGFRPTMQDDQGSHIIITVFDMGGPTEAVKEIGEVAVKAAGPAVTVKATPTFKVRVAGVSKSATT